MIHSGKILLIGFASHPPGPLGRLGHLRAPKRLTLLFPAPGAPQINDCSARQNHRSSCSQRNDAQGKTVRYLSVEKASRPQRLVPEGTTLYWDGKLEDGTTAPPGRYMVCLRTSVGGTEYTVYSAYFTLNEEITSG